MNLRRTARFKRTEFRLSVIYLIALVVVGLAIVALTLDTVLSVSRKPRWGESLARPMLYAVPTVDRREADLPFVGADRRQADQAARTDEVRTSRAA